MQVRRVIGRQRRHGIVDQHVDLGAAEDDGFGAAPGKPGDGFHIGRSRGVSNNAEAEFLERVIQQDLCPEQHLRPLVRRRVAPGGKSGFRRGHGQIHLRRATHWDAGDDAAAGWVEDRTAGLDYYKSKGIATYSTYATRNLCRENNFPQAEYTFEGDTTFNIHNTVFETFYPGAGHSSDNIVVYFPKDRLLVGGCFVKSVEATDLGNLSDANIGMWRVSAKTLIKKYPKVKTVIPGHQKIAGKSALKHTLKLAKEKYKGRKQDKKKAKH